MNGKWMRIFTCGHGDDEDWLLLIEFDADEDGAEDREIAINVPASGAVAAAVGGAVAVIAESGSELN